MNPLLIDLATRTQEAIILKGIAQQILSLNNPTVENVRGFFEPFGLSLLSAQEVEAQLSERDTLYARVAASAVTDFLELDDPLRTPQQGVMGRAGAI